MTGSPRFLKARMKQSLAFLTGATGAVVLPTRGCALRPLGGQPLPPGGRPRRPDGRPRRPDALRALGCIPPSPRPSRHRNKPDGSPPSLVAGPAAATATALAGRDA